MKIKMSDSMVSAALNLPMFGNMTTSGSEFAILKSKNTDDLIIAGYASVDVVDKQNDKITLDALNGAVTKFMGSEYKNVMLTHSNVQVGEVLDNWRDSKGRLLKTGVDDVGFFVVIKIRDDIEKAKEVAREIRKGKLRSFSIGGQAIRKRNVHDTDVGTYKEIDKLELHEVTICEEGINPEAKFDIVKELKGNNMSEEIEKALAEFNGVLSELKKEVNQMQKEYDGEPLSEDAPAEEEETLEMADDDDEKMEYASDDTEETEEKAVASIPFGTNQDGSVAGREYTATSGSADSDYSAWSARKATDLPTLDLSNENVEKAYAEFKREQEESRAYNVIKNEFERRYSAEVDAESAQIQKENYDAHAEVESLKEQFTDLRKSLENTDNVIAKVQEPVQQQMPEHIANKLANIGELSWAELSDLQKEMGY
tara:strand:+ start:2523 stop:3800 length:1278 start_codon:yes stop_codon:yes gene_type:complete